MARPDLEALLNALLPFAKHMLRRHGEFLPFGATLGADGQVAYASAQMEEERPAPQEIIERLVEGFRAQGGLRAAGICVDVKTVPPGGTAKVDAMCFRLEHQDGEAIHVFAPYRRRWLGGVKLGELFACEGVRVVFG